MLSGQKRGRSEGLDLSDFCQSFAVLLHEAGLMESALYKTLSTIDASKLQEEADLITAVKSAENSTAFDGYLLTLGLACAGEISAKLINYLFKVSQSIKLSETAKGLVDAAKYDLGNTMQAQEDPVQFSVELLKSMLVCDPYNALLELFKKTGSCCTDWITAQDTAFNGNDHAALYLALIGEVVREHRGADGLLEGAAKQKANAQHALRQQVEATLKELGCNEVAIQRFAPQLIQQPMQLPVLTGEYNARLIKSVEDSTTKQAFMQQLLDEFNAHARDSEISALSKRQRLDLLPAGNQQTLFAVLENEMSPFEYMNFTLENVQDEVLVMSTIEQNKDYFVTGDKVFDCCSAILPQHRIQVLTYLLADTDDEEYIYYALNGLDDKLVAEYLEDETPRWMSLETFSYQDLVNYTQEGSDFEKLLLKNMVNIESKKRNSILRSLHNEHGANFMIHALSLLNHEARDAYICFTKAVADGASKSSLKTLFTLLWQCHAQRMSVSDIEMINMLSDIESYDLWSDTQNARRIESFNSAANRFLAKMPDKLAIALINSMQRVMREEVSLNFLATLKKRKLYLRNRYARTCSNFSLAGFITLCNRIVKPGKIVAAFNGALDLEDVQVLADLVESKRVTIKSVRSCVRRCYKIYKDSVPVFSFTSSMNVFLILFSRYDAETFKTIVQAEFNRLYVEAGSFIDAVTRFPAESRVAVLKYAPMSCPAAELHQLFIRRRFSGEYQSGIMDCVKRLMKKVSKRKREVYLGYLQALYNANKECFIEYCGELTSLRDIGIAEYVRLAGNWTDRLDIALALGRYLTVENILPLLDGRLIELSFESINKLAMSVENEYLKHQLQSERCDLSLSVALYLDANIQQGYLKCSSIFVKNAYQLGIYISMLSAEMQYDQIANYVGLINSEAKLQYVLDHCHADVKAKVGEAFRQHNLPQVNQAIKEDMQYMQTLEEFNHVLFNRMPTSRFELLCEWLYANGCQVFESDRQNKFGVLCNIIAFLPKQYQLHAATKFVHLLKTEGEMNVVLSSIEDAQERIEFTKRWKQTHGLVNSPVKAIGHSPFGLFKKIEPRTDTESPSKKTRRRLLSSDDGE